MKRNKIISILLFYWTQFSRLFKDNIIIYIEMQCPKIELHAVTAVTAVMVVMVAAVLYLLTEIKKSRIVFLQGEN
jgi:hypothetical protein